MKMPVSSSELAISVTTDVYRSSSIARRDLDELARWVPKKEMELLTEICERAERDPDLARPALLLCAAYAQSVARMLDQDPFPSVTRQIADSLRQLQGKNGL